MVLGAVKQEEQQGGGTAPAAAADNNSSSQQHGGDMISMDELAPLQPSQMNRLKFPLQCPVFCIVAADGEQSSSESSICPGVVKKAFLHLVSRQVVYQIVLLQDDNKNDTTNKNPDDQNNEGLLVMETNLLYGKGTAVWAVAPGASDRTAAVVCNACLDEDTPETEPLYSVQTAADGWVIHYIPTDAVEYRGDDSNNNNIKGEVADTGQVSSPPKKEEQHLDHPPSGVVVETEHTTDATTTAATGDDQNTMGSDRPLPRVTQDDYDAVASPSSAESPSSKRAGGGDVNQAAFDPKRRRSSDLEPQQQQQQRQQHPQQHERGGGGRPPPAGGFIRHYMILPDWMDASSVKAQFRESQMRLQQATDCQLLLRGRAVEGGHNGGHQHQQQHDLYFDIDGHPDAIDGAFSRLEEFLLGPLASIDIKCLLMHDIAQCNPEYYRRAGHNLVYQRDGALSGHPWRWMMAIDFPEDMGNGGGIALVVGAKGRGVRQMQGATNCLFRVTRSPRFCVFVSGQSQEEMYDCQKRIAERIAWARTELHGAPRRF